MRESFLPKTGKRAEDLMVDMEEESPQVLVTGSTGFIGSHLVEFLLRQGARVRCLVRSCSNLRYLKDLNVDLVTADLRNRGNWGQAIRGVDYIFHLAGVTAAATRREYFEGNLLTTRRLVESCMREGNQLKRFIHISSVAAGGPSRDGRPVNENQIARPISSYGHSKLAAERLVLESRLPFPVTVIRPSIVYGPRDRDIYKFFRMAQTGTITHVGHRNRYVSLIHVRDLVTGLMEVMRTRENEDQCYYFTNPQFYSRRGLAHEIALSVQRNSVRQIAIPEPWWYLAGFGMELLLPVVKDPSILSREKVWEACQDFWICSPAKALKHLGWQSVISLQEGLRDTARWYRLSGWLQD